MVNQHKDFAVKSERIHTMSQLLKAYTLFEKDVEYVVIDNKCAECPKNCHACEKFTAQDGTGREVAICTQGQCFDG